MMKNAQNSWYLDWFGKDYLELYQHRDDDEAETQVGFICSEESLSQEDTVVDVACGRGRHLKAIQLKVGQCIGLDRSREALQTAQESFNDRTSKQVHLLEADMRKLPLRKETARLMLCMFTSFGYFETDEQHLIALRDWTRVLNDSGTLVLDYLNRDWVLKNLKVESKDIRGDTTVSQRRRITPDLKRVEKKIIIERGDNTPRFYSESVRMFTLTELVKMLRLAGLTVDRIYGGFDGSQFAKNSERLILFANKAEK